MNRIRDVYINLNIYGFNSYNLALLKEKYARHRIIKKYIYLDVI